MSAYHLTGVSLGNDEAFFLLNDKPGAAFEAFDMDLVDRAVVSGLPGHDRASLPIKRYRWRRRIVRVADPPASCRRSTQLEPPLTVKALHVDGPIPVVHVFEPRDDWMALCIDGNRGVPRAVQAVADATACC